MASYRETTMLSIGYFNGSDKDAVLSKSHRLIKQDSHLKKVLASWMKQLTPNPIINTREHVIAFKEGD